MKTLRYKLRNQRGGGTLKGIIYLIFLAVAVFVAIKVVPAYVAEYQLKDKMEEQARFAVVNHYSEEQVRDILYKVVQDLGIPAKREDIKVRNNNQGLEVTLDYTVPVDLMVYKTDLHFTPSSTGINLMK